MPLRRPAPVTIATFPSRGPIRVLSWRRFRRGYVTGFADVEQPSSVCPGPEAPARQGHAAGSVTHSPVAAALRAAGGTRGSHCAGRVALPGGRFRTRTVCKADLTNRGGGRR